jgi:hypothetical protein
MNEETRRVLEMLSQGKITVEEADRLMQAVGAPRAEPVALPGPDGQPAKPRFFRITVNKAEREGRKAETVNVRVPMSVIRGGLKLGAIIPGLSSRLTHRFQEKGIDLDLSKINGSELEAMLNDLGELTVDVDGDGAQVRIRCE